MITKKNCYYFLILSTLVSFAIFGSLSHIFSLGLILLVLSTRLTRRNSSPLELQPVVLYTALTGCFFLFLLHGLLNGSLRATFISLGPMIPIPFIGLLIIFQEHKDFKITSRQVAKFSKIAVLIAFLIYIVLSTLSGPQSIFYKFHTGRVELFSGNPIPFSYVMVGVSFFCLADWWNSDTKNRILAFLFFLIGVWFSGYLSGTRGTLLSIIITSPVIFFYLSKSIKLAFVFLILTTLVALFVLKMEPIIFGKNNLDFIRTTNGLRTLMNLENSDQSTSLRLQMWFASLKAVSNEPLFGYGPTNRFSAIQAYLPNSFQNTYSHPHNDILAGAISSGFLGGLAAFFSLISIFLASVLNSKKSIEKILLGLMILISTIVTANVSTIFFNDISSAWLAFSTYLIWAVDFREKQNEGSMLGY